MINHLRNINEIRCNKLEIFFPARKQTWLFDCKNTKRKIISHYVLKKNILVMIDYEELFVGFVEPNLLP